MDPLNVSFPVNMNLQGSARSGDRDADGRQLLDNRQHEPQEPEDDKQQPDDRESSSPEPPQHPKPLDNQGTHLDFDA